MPKTSSPAPCRVTFTLQEAGAICRVPVKWLCTWTTDNVLHPAVRGNRGPGNGHRLSGQQLYAVAALGALIRAGKRPTRSYMSEVFDLYESMSDAALAEFCGGAGKGVEVNDVTEEAIGDYLGKLETTGMFDQNRHPMTPSDIRCSKDMAERHARVDQAIAIRSKARPKNPDRVSDIVR